MDEMKNRAEFLSSSDVFFIQGSWLPFLYRPHSWAPSVHSHQRVTGFPCGITDPDLDPSLGLGSVPTGKSQLGPRTFFLPSHPCSQLQDPPDLLAPAHTCCAPFALPRAGTLSPGRGRTQETWGHTHLIALGFWCPDSALEESSL